MRKVHCIGFILAAILFASHLPAQTVPRTDTPPLVQITLGPTLGDLPDFGSMYCAPTATTMELLWLGNNGFGTLAPTNYDQNNPADLPTAQNLDRVIAGLMGTSALDGTNSDQIDHGISTYLNLEGFSGLYTLPTHGVPTAANLAEYVSGYNINILSIAWYRDSGTTVMSGTNTLELYQRNSGHFVALLGASGTDATINNPEPATLLPVANTPANVQQTVSTGTIPGTIYLSGSSTDPFDANLQFITSKHTGTDGEKSLAVIAGVNVVQFSGSLNPATFTPQTFNIDQDTTIDTNGGSFTTAAPIVSDFLITKTGSGTMTLGNTVQGSGGFTVTGGTLESIMTNADATPVSPFGGGDVRLIGGGLAISPTAAGDGNAHILVASGSNHAMTYGAGGNTLMLNRGTNTTLTVQIGGHNGDGQQNLAQDDFGTLQIVTSDGPAGLGNTTKLLLAGSGSNLPITHNGIVSPSIVAQQNNADASGVFLSYSETNGFVQAATTNGNSFAGTDDTTIFQTTGDIAFTGTATVAALIANNKISGDVLQVTPDSADGAGVILNNGAEIAATALDFGDRNAFIYSSNGGGTISSSIHTENSVITFGPGQTTLSGLSTSISGTVYVNSGTLTVKNSGVGAAPVTVNKAATLNITGIVSGTVTATAGSTVMLSGGTMSSAPILSNASTLGGHGLVQSSGNLTLAGNIGSPTVGGQLTFDAAGTTAVGTGTEATLNFTLTNLTSGANAFNQDWTGFIFVNDVVIGTTADPITVGLNFSSVSDPDDPTEPTGFWNSDHEWRFLEFDGTYVWSGSNYKFLDNYFYNGTFGMELVTGTAGNPSYVDLTYTAAPEPATWALLFCGGLGLLAMRAARKAA